MACRPRRPQTKGKVERPFLFIEKNLLGGREFRCLDHLNEVAAWWLREVADVRLHRQTKRRPLDLHAEELPHLIPLPDRPYEVAEMVYRTVDAEGFIPYGNNRYSVPWHYIGQVLAVRISAKSIERILAVQARPKTALDRMAEDQPSHLGELLSDDPTPPRPATEYQNLLFEEPHHDEPSEEKDDADPEDRDEPF